jgi:hypothetical protein
MSEHGECFVCGQSVDNDDGTGYCSACAADIGVYVQRDAASAAGSGTEADSEVAALRLAVDSLSGELRELSAALGRVVERVEGLERRLEDTESWQGASGTPRENEVPRDATAQTPRSAGSDLRQAGITHEAGIAHNVAAPTLEQRAQAVGVNYARLRKLYSEEELRMLIDG